MSTTAIRDMEWRADRSRKAPADINVEDLGNAVIAALVEQTRAAWAAQRARTLAKLPARDTWSGGHPAMRPGHPVSWGAISLERWKESR